MSAPLYSILHPSARPDKWRAVHGDWMQKAAHPADVQYVICMDSRWGFTSADSLAAQTCGCVVVWNEGRRCYVDAVNTAARASSGQILIVIADDQFACEGWDEAIIARVNPRHLYSTMPWALEISTGTPKEHERGIIVMPILSRQMYDDQGSVVFYPEYESMFADNDFCAWAKQDGVLLDGRRRSDGSELIFPHKHWINGQREKDEVDAVQNRKEAMALGASIFARRQREGFGPEVSKESGESGQSAGPIRSIALCLSGDHFQGAWVDGLMALVFHVIQRGFTVIPLRSWITYTSNVYATREEIRKAVMSLDPRPEMLLWLDDDNICSPEHFDVLLADLDARPDADGVTAWCWIHNEAKTHFQPSVGNFAPDGNHWQPLHPSFMHSKELRPVEATGFPCFLMRYSALEKAGDQPFIRGILDQNLAHGIGGEDLAFCRAAAQGGAHFLVDPRVRVPHLKYVEVEPTLVDEGLPDPKISVMLRVKNEARWIGRVIDSVKELGPVFVMDDGSSDGTGNIALDHGAHVAVSRFLGQPLDERRDKNWLLHEFVIPGSNPDFVLCIDGDEELQAGGVEKIRRACQQGAADVYCLRFLYLWDRPDQARFDGRYSTLSRFSLFKVVPGLNFQSVYKSQVDVNHGLHTGNAPLDTDKEVIGQALNVFLLHYGYMLPEDRRRKYEWYNQIDPNNELEDCYRHIIQGDSLEVPASANLKHAGPLDLRKLPASIAPKDFDIEELLSQWDSMQKGDSGFLSDQHSAVRALTRELVEREQEAAVRLVGGPVIVPETRSLRLNLGCSDAIQPGYLNVDVCEPCDMKADLRERWPWPDSSVEYIRAWDIIEHLPDTVHTMNEAFRVLKPGGRFEIVVPTTDGRGAYQDPTHVSFWNRNSFFYFEHGNPHLTRFRKGNGVNCAFQIVAEDQRVYPDGVVKLAITLEAVKPSLAMAAD